MIVGNIILGIRLTPNNFKRIEIENADLECKVELFKNEITKQIGVEKDSIELIYCGLTLEDDQSLVSCGIKSGVMIHVLKRHQLPQIATHTPTDIDVQQLVVAFRAFTLTPGYRAALQRLSRPDVLENIIASVPGLIEDPVAIAMIHDPELIVQFSDPETVKRIAEHHPSLIQAANYIAAHIHEEPPSTNGTHAGTSTGYSYSLEALSDDDDMDSNEPPREANPLTRNTSYGAITAAQLADAIYNSTQGNFGLSNQAGVQNIPVNPNVPAGNVITNEMFLNAIQQAIASSPSANTNFINPFNSSNTPILQTTNTNQSGEASEDLRVQLQPQLQQMHEMGLTNESLNIRALQITAGNVEGAIELVFNGAIE